MTPISTMLTSIWIVTAIRPGCEVATRSPNPTVEKIVTVM